MPAGLGKSSEAAEAMLEFFDLGPFELAAAAEESPPMKVLPDRKAAVADWLESVDDARLRSWLLWRNPQL